MSSSSSLLKTLLHKTISEGIYKEIASRTARYYYFLGKTISWEDETAPQFPIDSVQYEKATRNEIITVKEIKPADISFVIPRIDWFYGNTYDIYDDNYSTELMGIDLSNGGLGYLSIPTVEISAPNDINGIQATAVAVVFEYVAPLYVKLVTLVKYFIYPQLILTTVGLLAPVLGSFGLFLCQSLIASNASVIDIPVPLSLVPSNPLNF